MFGHKTRMIDPADALPGREAVMPVPAAHHTNGAPLTGPWPRAYAAAIFAASQAQRTAAKAPKAMFQERLRTAGFGDITTEIADAATFYYAEPYHQQYLAKNPNGYCGLGETGVSCPVGLSA